MLCTLECLSVQVSPHLMQLQLALAKLAKLSPRHHAPSNGRLNEMLSNRKTIRQPRTRMSTLLMQDGEDLLNAVSSDTDVEPSTSFIALVVPHAIVPVDPQTSQQCVFAVVSTTPPAGSQHPPRQNTTRVAAHSTGVALLRNDEERQKPGASASRPYRRRKPLDWTRSGWYAFRPPSTKMRCQID